MCKINFIVWKQNMACVEQYYTESSTYSSTSAGELYVGYSGRITSAM